MPTVLDEAVPQYPRLCRARRSKRRSSTTEVQGTGRNLHLSQVGPSRRSRRHRVVGLLHEAALEELLVRTAHLTTHREQQNPAGQSVQAVHRRKVVDTELTSGTDDGGLGDVLSPGQCRHERRLVGDEDVLVAVQQVHVTGHRAFRGGTTVEPDEGTPGHRVCRLENRAVVEPDLSATEPLVECGFVVGGVVVVLGLDEVTHRRRSGRRRVESHP